MRSYTIATLLITVLFGAYVYTAVEAVCKTPITYRIGNIDNRYDLSYDEARLAASDAESVWEQATGENLFTYDPQGELVINFVYDERQEFAEAEEDFRERLNAAEDMNEEVRAQYEELVEEYEVLESEYKRDVAVYESELASYNATVQEYNSQGGAPPDEYQKLQEERERLDDALFRLQAQAQTLNQLVDEINSLSERGNQLVENYNENVGTYNQHFAESHEYTQGDYRVSDINIYKFIDMTELKLVLTHEFGHALSLDHVPGEASIMYSHMGAQPEEMVLSGADIEEFERVCGRTTRSFIERLFIRFGI